MRQFSQDTTNTCHTIPHPYHKEIRVMRNLFIAILAVVSTLGFTAAAKADSPSPLNTETPKYSVAQVSSNVIDSSVAISSSAAKGKILLEDNTVAGASKKIDKQKCRWYKDFWNTGKNTSGHKKKFKDKHGYLCKDSHSPTGYVKRGGGLTGRDCRNEASPIHVHVPHAPSVPRSKVKLVKAFKWIAHATAKAVAKLSGSAKSTCTAPGVYAESSFSAMGSGEASASASASASSKSSALSKAKSVAIKSVDTGSATAKAKADAKAQIDGKASSFCSGQVHTPTCQEMGTCPPPDCTTTGTCPPPAENASAVCTNLTVTNSLSVANGVHVHVDYQAVNARFVSMVVDYGNGVKRPVSSTDDDYVYANGNTYFIVATLSFTTPSGKVLNATCSGKYITPKDPSQGAGSTTPGPAGGSGTGTSTDPSAGNGPGSPTDGGICRNPSGDIVSCP